MRAMLLIAGKDLRQRTRDASAMLMAIVLPLALAGILDLTLGRAVSQQPSFRYAVVDLDRGELGAAFRTGVLGDAERRGLIRVTSAQSVSAARRMVGDGRVSAAIVVPAGFSRAVAGGGTPSLQVIGDVDQTLPTEVARSLADGYAQRLNAIRLSVATAVHGGPSGGGSSGEAEAAALVRAAERIPAPVGLQDVSATKRELDAKTYLSAGMAVFFLFFTVQFGVTSLLDERKDGTMARLLAAPIGRGSILAGKLLAAFALGVFTTVVLVLATALLLGAHWGNPAGVGLLIVAGVTAAVAIMALVATLARTSEQAGNWQSVIALVLGMLGGAFFSVAQAGGVFVTLSLLTPHAWFLRGLADLSAGAGPAAVLPAVGAMLAFAAVTGGIALLRLGRLARP